MKITLRLVEPDETAIVEVDGRDRRAAEISLGRILGRPPQTSWVDLLQTAPETALAWQAWHACRRQGIAPGDVEWPAAETRIVEIEIDDDQVDEVLPDPTRPAPSAG